MRTIGLGILGLGNIADALVKQIEAKTSEIQTKSDVNLDIRKVLIKDRTKSRDLPSEKLTTDIMDIVTDLGIDIVVELIGGENPALNYVQQALEYGKDVVTANKTLIANNLDELFELAKKKGSRLGFEASVCGGIPVIRILRGFTGFEEYTGITGIVNGTTNYILTRMAHDNCDFDEAVKQAQEFGYAEADSTLDIEGNDSASKLGILAKLAFGVQLNIEKIKCRGITEIGLKDIQAAKELGYAVRLLASADFRGQNGEFVVEPFLVPLLHPLANVHNAYNALILHSKSLQDQMYYGLGAGKLPTASAVLSDILEIAADKSVNMKIKPAIKDINIRFKKARYYLRFPIPDSPGVIGAITSELGKAGISILEAKAYLSDEKVKQGQVQIVTHSCRREVLDNVLDKISNWPELLGKPVKIRFLDETEKEG